MDHTQGTRSLILLVYPPLFYCCVFLGVAGVFSVAFAVDISNGGSVSVTAVVPEGAVIVAPISSSGGGGGGGGGGGILANPFSSPADSTLNDAVFEGRAYPGSIVTLLKDGVIATEVPASPDASFKISLAGLKAGTYNFGIRAEDTDGRRSAIQIYTVSVSAGATTVVKGIFLPPTITADKVRVKPGEGIALAGSAPPGAIVSIAVDSETAIYAKVSADANGRWSYMLDLAGLKAGIHEVRARAENDTDMSPFSQSISFALGDGLSPDIKIPKDVSAIDINGDGRINITDFSVMAYWFRRSGPPADVDENHDGKVDLTDFSILAYYWTG